MVAMVNPEDIPKLDELCGLSDRDIKPPRDLRVIDRGISRFYGEKHEPETASALVEPGLVVQASLTGGHLRQRGACTGGFARAGSRSCR